MRLTWQLSCAVRGRRLGQSPQLPEKGWGNY
jgi:hypothetical protein